MYRIHRSVDVSFSHHVRGHSGPCVNVHGHTWKFEVGLGANELDLEGFVVDFGRLKSAVLQPVHALLDHAFAVGETTFAEIESSLAPLGERLIQSRRAVHGPDHQSPPPLDMRLQGAQLRYPGGMKVCVFPFAPTSERLARWLWDLADTELADARVQVAFARVYETLHPVESVAEWRPD
ncbi:MAG: 6-carboxytetrahydropterin synthase [Myxococcota bacterium]